MSETRVIKDVPESEVEEIVRDFESEGCEVTTSRQENGLWTISAECES